MTTSFTYDPEGRLTRTTRPDGKHSDSTYDYAGNRLTFADEKPRTTSYFYDNESRLVRVEASAQAPVEYVYDDAGNMLYIEVNDDEYRRTDYAYDKLNRRTSETFPQGYNNQRNVRYYSYDAAHNVGIYRDGRDVLTIFGCDGVGRVISKVYEVPENRPEIREVPDVGYAYDANGNLTSISNSDGAASWSYDSLDRLQTEQVANGPQITYVYDPRGVILSETVNGQSKLSTDHEYDAVGRRIKTTQDGQETEFTWDGALRRTKVTLPSGEYTVYAYDNVDRQEDIYYRKADDTLFEHYAYTYDDVGNPTALETMNGDYSYGYDTAYRLTSESRTGFKPYSIAHVYDSMGNRTQRTTDNVVRTFTYNKADQITGWEEPSTDKTAEYVYDSDGNTIQKLVYEDEALIDQWDYEFDSVGRMAEGQQSVHGTKSILNVYAGDQWYRASETINSTTRKYGWRRDELFAEFNSSGELTAGYLNDGVDRPIYKTRFEEDGETVAARDFYHQDANLRVHHVTDADGDVAEKYVYTGYGERKILEPDDDEISTSAIGNRIGFQGREHEDLSGPGQAHGLTFHRNRFYDPDTGTFKSRWADYSQDVHTYRFQFNGPLFYIDPHGDPDPKPTTIRPPRPIITPSTPPVVTPRPAITPTISPLTAGTATTGSMNNTVSVGTQVTQTKNVGNMVPQKLPAGATSGTGSPGLNSASTIAGASLQINNAVTVITTGNEVLKAGQRIFTSKYCYLCCDMPRGTYDVEIGRGLDLSLNPAEYLYGYAGSYPIICHRWKNGRALVTHKHIDYNKPWRHDVCDCCTSARVE